MTLSAHADTKMVTGLIMISVLKLLNVEWERKCYLKVGSDTLVCSIYNKISVRHSEIYQYTSAVSNYLKIEIVNHNFLSQSGMIEIRIFAKSLL